MFCDIQQALDDLFALVGADLPASPLPRRPRHHDPEPGPRRGRPSGALSGPGRQGLFSGRKLAAPDLQIVLLALLSQKSAHGYELIKSLEEQSDGFYVPSPGVIYPALTYLTEIGFTASETEGNKKLYHLTPAGQEHFAANRAVAERVRAELARFGAQMIHARRALARPVASERDRDMGDVHEGDEIGDEMEAIRREIRRVQRDKGPLPPEELRRITDILDRAAHEIRLGPEGEPPPPHRVHPPHRAHASHLARLVGPHAGPEGKRPGNPAAAKELGAFVSPAQADFIYLLCRALGATRVVESAASLGLSAMYLASAVRDNGGGIVIGSESMPEKVQTARRNLAEAGLADLVEVREGDARETLRDLGGPIDVLLIGSATTSPGGPTARQILAVVVPQMHVGSVVLAADSEPGYLAYVRDPANGFCSMPLPFKEATELSVKVS